MERQSGNDGTVWPVFRTNRDAALLIGYARVSTQDQSLELQRDALRAEGCERTFEDTAAGTGERPALTDAFEHLRTGDTLVVWRQDRLGRSLKNLIEKAETLRCRGIGLRSLKEASDTDSSAGQLTFHMFGALAKFEGALIRQRTRASRMMRSAGGSSARTSPAGWRRPHWPNRAIAVRMRGMGQCLASRAQRTSDE